MSEVVFKKLYQGNFERDPKLKALDDAFDSFYRDSESLNDTDARILWSELRSYAKDLGFTANQFHDANLRASGRIKATDRR